MNNNENNMNVENNPNSSNTIPTVPQNGQILYDQNGNPVSVVQSTSPNNTVQTTNQQPPQVVTRVEKQPGATKVVYQQAPQQTVNSPNQPPKQNNTSKSTEEKKPGKIRYVLLVLFFILILALIWFLPDLRKMMTERKMDTQKEVINGTLKCVYEEEEELLTTLYTSEFEVQNNKLKAYTSTVETKGDTGSEEELAKRNTDCESLKKMAKNISGITISCSLNSRKQINKQELDYTKVNKKSLNSAYSEAGGVVPDYNLDDDALQIKKEMTLARYSCTVN